MKVKMKWFHAVAAAAMLAALPATDVLAAPAKTPAKKAPVKKPWRLDVSKMKFVLTTNKNPIQYKVGDDVEFRVIFDWGQEVPEDQKKPMFVQWERSGDDGIRFSGMDSIAPGKDVIIKTKLDRPGFIRFTGRLLDITGKGFVYFKHGEIRTPLSFDAGAGCNVDEILPAATEPADFDTFWKGVHAQLAKVPVKATVKKIADDQLPEKYRGKFTVSEVTVACAGPRPVTGYLYQRADIKPKSMPVQVMFDGYGPGPMEKIPMDNWIFSVAQDKIVFRINAHGYDLGKDKAYYDKFFAERPSYGFSMKENAKPETSYFCGMAMRVIRAFDYVKTLPGWNGKDLIAAGPSFGGCQTIVAAALDKDITLACPGGAAMADHRGADNRQKEGWPRLLKSRQAKADAKKAKENSAYFDVANFARLIKCPVVFSVGFIDTVCPPTSVYSAYNNVPGKNKMMINGTRAEHGANRKLGEGGAFSAGDSAAIREIFMGTQMLSNTDMDYVVPGTKAAKGETVPYIWDFRKGVAKAMKEGDTTFVRLTKNMTFFQNIYNLRKKECKLTVNFTARGKGRISLMVSSAEPPVYRFFNLTEKWQTFQAEYVLKDGSYHSSFIFTVTGDVADIDKVSAVYSLGK